MGGRGAAAGRCVDVALLLALALPRPPGGCSRACCRASLRCAVVVVHVTEALPDELDRIVRYACGRASPLPKHITSPPVLLRGSLRQHGGVTRRSPSALTVVPCACVPRAPPPPQVSPDAFAAAVRGLNDVLREHQPSGCGGALAAFLCPCTCGLSALWCQRQVHVAYAEGMLYLTALNARPTWRAVGITWSLERVKLAMHVRCALPPPAHVAAGRCCLLWCPRLLLVRRHFPKPPAPASVHDDAHALRSYPVACCPTWCAALCQLLISLTPPAEPSDVDEGGVRLKFGSSASHANSARSAHPVSPLKKPRRAAEAPAPSLEAAGAPEDMSPVQFHEPDAAYSEFSLRHYAPIFLNHRWYSTMTHWFQSQK